MLLTLLDSESHRFYKADLEEALSIVEGISDPTSPDQTVFFRIFQPILEHLTEDAIVVEDSVSLVFRQAILSLLAEENVSVTTSEIVNTFLTVFYELNPLIETNYYNKNVSTFYYNKNIEASYYNNNVVVFA